MLCCEMAVEEYGLKREEHVTINCGLVYMMELWVMEDCGEPDGGVGVGEGEGEGLVFCV